MADWTLNELIKSVNKTYVAGSAGVTGSPGLPETPAYCYWETATTTTASLLYSALAPQGYETYYTDYGLSIGYYGYRYFDGRKLYFSGIDDATGAYVYYDPPGATYQREVCLEAQPGVPPIAAVAPTDSQILVDYNLGWNSGAVGESILAENRAFEWRFPSSDVGAAVGITSVYTLQGNSYNEMDLCVVAQGGTFVVLVDRVLVTPYIEYSSDETFAIIRYADRFELYYAGGLVTTLESTEDVVPDCSLYCGGDRILDARDIAANEVIIKMMIASSASNLSASGKPTRTFGPGTENGIVSLGSISNLHHVKMLEGTTITNLVATGIRTRTFGPDTENGIVALGSRTNAVLTYTYAYAYVAMLPMSGAGAGPDVAVGWTGNFVGDAVRMAPMTAYGEAGLIEPNFGIGDCIMVPMTAIGLGLTGETTISSNGRMLALSGIGAETSYAIANVNTLALTVYGDDIEEVNTGVAFLQINPFILISEGEVADINGGTMVARNKFSAMGYGGGQMRASAADFILTAEASSPGVGTLQEAIGYV